jgi:hypothetical protein
MNSRKLAFFILFLHIFIYSVFMFGESDLATGTVLLFCLVGTVPGKVFILIDSEIGG